MTDDRRLRETGERLFGHRWQTAMARALGVSDRRVRQWVSGDRVPGGVWRDLERLELEQRGWPRDEWLIADEPEGNREYIVHTRAPRFIARVVNDDDDADHTAGVTYSLHTGETLCEIVWLDQPPLDEPSLLDLFQRAETALSIYTDDSFEALAVEP